MSDRMSTVEIEDVLSSIRRLVSEDLRVAPPAEPARKPAPRLVLTQALRVDAPRAEVGPGDPGEGAAANFAASLAGPAEGAGAPLQLAQPTDPAGDRHAGPAARFAGAAETARAPLQLAQPAAAVDGTFAEPAAGFAGPVERAGGMHTVLPADPANGAASALPADPVEETPADFAADDSPPELAARLAELEAILDAQEQSFDDEAGAALEPPLALHRLSEVPEAPFHDDDTPHAALEPEAAVLFPPRVPQAARGAVREVDEATLLDTRGETGGVPAAAPAVQAVGKGEPEAAFAAAPEAAFDAAPRAVAYTAPAEPAYAAAPQAAASPEPDFDTAPHGAYAASPEPAAAPQAALAADAAMFSWTEATTPGAPAYDPGAQDDLPLLDEDTLRALIRDVLREELQGEIGERVTRNLRKMIRTEIARALTARGIV